MSCDYKDVNDPHNMKFVIDHAKKEIDGISADGATHPTELAGGSIAATGNALIYKDDYVLTLDIPNDKRGKHVRETYKIDRHSGSLEISSTDNPDTPDAISVSLTGSCQDISNQAPKL